MSLTQDAMNGRILAIDFGLKRVGAAICDREGKVATPLETYTRRTEALDAQHYAAIAREERVDRLVVGLPVLASGDEGALAVAAREFGEWLGRVMGVPVVYFDERYTTVMAEELLREQGLKSAKRKQLRDRVAALLLLQAYLDAGCPMTGQNMGRLDDPEQGSNDG